MVETRRFWTVISTFFLGASIAFGQTAEQPVRPTQPAQQPTQPAQMPIQQPQREDVDERSQIMSELGELQQKSRSVQQQLGQIQEQAEQQNPELENMHQAVLNIYREKLVEYDYPSDEEIQRLQQTQQRLRDPELDEAERQRLTQEFKAKVSKLQQIQQRAQNDPAVQEAHQRIEAARSKAMAEINPETSDLMSTQEELQRKIMELQMRLQQQQQTP